jgi:hypothetical protein
VTMTLENKKKILGLNAAKLYDLPIPAEAGSLVAARA